jgi:hypothetical protein
LISEKGQGWEVEMTQRKDGDPKVPASAAGTAKSPDDSPGRERRSAEGTDRSEQRMTSEQQRRLRDLCQKSGAEFRECLTPEEAEARIAELERILR